MARMKPGEASPAPAAAWMKSTKVSRAPTHTTNITGLRTCTRGSSFLSESRAAAPMRRQSKDRSLASRGWTLLEICVPAAIGCLSLAGHHQVFDDRDPGPGRAGS